MVYTVTFNPSLDYIVSVNDFQMGMTNRTCAEQMLPGGKGINVSTVLQQVLQVRRLSAEWQRSALHMILYLYRRGAQGSISN